MPCACQKPQPSYPGADNWGPVLWAILHGLAERSGKVVIPVFLEDEKRQWISMIQILPKIIPCPDCRQHAELWILQNPITAIKTMSATELHDYLVNWVYRLHEDVNARTGKASFDESLLTQKYGSISIQGALNSLKPFIETAIRMSGITLLPWNKWNGFVKMLCSLYGA
jgi:hypothetical protein